MRALVLNLFLSLVSVLVCCLVLEAGVRLLGIGEGRPSRPPGEATRSKTPIYEPSPELGWSLRPDTVQVFSRRGFDTRVRSNALGLRGPQIGPKPDSVTRIVVVGDSYAFGWGVEGEATYGAQLERLLEAQRPGEHFEVVVAALPGFGTFQKTRALELVLPYGADWVIAEFSVANDVVDDWRARHYVPERLAAYQIEGTRYPAFETWLAAHSRLVALVRARGMPLRFWLECRRSPNLERSKALWSALVERCRRAGVPLVLVLNPSRSQVLRDEPGLPQLLARVPYAERPNAMFRQLAREADVALIDVERIFRAAPEPGGLYLSDDPHWTVAGHRRVAEALAAVWPPPLQRGLPLGRGGW